MTVESLVQGDDGRAAPDMAFTRFYVQPHHHLVAFCAVRLGDRGDRGDAEVVAQHARPTRPRKSGATGRPDLCVGFDWHWDCDDR